jgi:hypothetical protein
LIEVKAAGLGTCKINPWLGSPSSFSPKIGNDLYLGAVRSNPAALSFFWRLAHAARPRRARPVSHRPVCLTFRLTLVKFDQLRPC